MDLKYLLDTSTLSAAIAAKPDRNVVNRLGQRSFPDLDLEPADYEQAASAFNRCRERGIQGSNADLLLCAVATRRKLAIYTRDGDFRQYAKVLKLALHEPRA